MGILSGISEFFGLDIGTSAIRVVQLRGKPPRQTVFRYGKIPLDNNLSQSSSPETSKYLAEKIREVLVHNQITTRNVVMGLPTDRIYSTVRPYENVSLSDLPKTLKFELEMIIPNNVENSKVDWSVLDRDIKDAEKRNVFICSVENEYAQQRLEMLEAINLNVLAFEPDALAVIRSSADANANYASLILDIGFHTSDIVIVNRNQPRLITGVPVGVFNIVKTVVNSLRVDQTEAHHLMFRVGIGNTGNMTLTTAIRQAIETLILQTRKALNFFGQNYPEHTLGSVVVYGEAVHIPGLIDFFTKTFKVPTIVGDSWQNVICPAGLEADFQILSPTFAVATGLAERQVI